MYAFNSDRLRESLLRIILRLSGFRNLLITRNLLFAVLFLKSLFLMLLLIAVFAEVSGKIILRFSGLFAVMTLFLLAVYTTGMLLYYSGKRIFRILKPYNKEFYSHSLGVYELFCSNNKNYSPELITDYAIKTEESLVSLDSKRLLFGNRVKRALFCLVSLLLILITISVLNYREVKGLFFQTGAVYTEKPGILIDLGKVRQEYYYPSYTGLEKVVRYNDKRTLEAIKGTVVRIRFENRIDADYARIITGNTYIDMKKDGLYFEGEIGLSEDGALRFDLFKRKIRYSSNDFRIRILADENPEIYLTGPENLLRGYADAGADRKINLSYSASDDFGVSRINIVVSISDGKEQSFRIQEIVPPVKEMNGEYLWDYSELSRYVQGELMFALEAEDNDTISGPKKNRTRFYRIIIPSSGQHFVKEISSLKELRRQMLHLLSLNLTYTSFSHYASMRQEKEIAKEVYMKIDEFLERRVKRDNTFEELKRILAELKYYSSIIGPSLRKGQPNSDGMVPKHLVSLISDETRMLEKNILVVQDIIDEVVYLTLSSLSNEITELRNELKALMKKYDETKDEEMRVRIYSVIDLLEKRMKDYREIQSELSKSFSDVNINRDALKNLSQDIDGIFRNIDQLKENLAQDEMEKFRKRLEELDNMISGITDDFSNMLSGLSGEKYRELMDSLKSMASDIENITDEERRISSALSKIEADIKKRYYDALKSLMDKKIEHIIGLIERLDSDITKDAHIIKKKSRDLKEYETIVEAQALLKTMPEMLKGYQIFEAFLTSRQVVSKMQWIKNIAGMFTDDISYRKMTEGFYDSSAEISEKIQEIINSSKQVLGNEEKRQLEKLISSQEKNMKEMESLASRASKLFSEFGNSFEKLNNNINAAKMSMALSVSSMKKEDVPAARSNADETISRLDDALKEIGKMQSRRNKMMTQGSDDEGEGGKRRFRTSEVKLPRKEDFKPKERLREEILKALSDDEIKGYEDFIRRYYEEILK
ncbi:MAG: hypothetical protein N3B13_01720 [Deltaproteobacteria bacterium]|nr:hypothetical protein [Deltaproteobacteria bacterium]